MKKIFLFLTLSAFSISCSSSDDDHLNSDLNGTWNMVSYSAFMPEPVVFSEGTIVWTFNMINKTVTITHAPHISFRYLENGTFPISGNEDRINLGSENKYSYRFENGKLILDSNIDGAADMPIITFSR